MTKQDFIAKHGAKAYENLIQHPNPKVEKMLVERGSVNHSCEFGDAMIKKILTLIGLETDNLLEAKQLITIALSKRR